MKLQSSQILAVFRKEVLDGVRDRRSVMSALLFPFLGPMMIVFMFNTIAERQRESADIDIPVVGAAYAPGLIDWIERSGTSVVEGPADPQEAVRSRERDFVLVIPANFAEDFAQGRTAEVELVHDGSRKDPAAAVRKVRTLVSSYSKMLGNLRLIARGVSPQVSHPVDIDEVDVASARKKAAHFLTFIPMFVILASFVTGMNIAVDATAGERERLSLEPLLINPVPRSGIVLGKWLAAVLFSSIGVLLTLASVMLALQRVPLQELGIQLKVSAPEIVGVLAAILPLALFASGLQVLIASFARSFKEAQTYLSLLIFLPMIPSIFSSIYSLDSQPWMIPIPSLGQQVVLIDILGGEPVGLLSFVGAGLSSLILGLGCVWLTARLFKREKIVFGH